MVVRKKRKIRRQRGSRSHGWGVVRDHKGSGSRGGFGKAGTNTHHYIQTVIQEKLTGKKIIGKFGFKRPQKRMYNPSTINVSHLNQAIDKLVLDGVAQLDGDIYNINLVNIGIEKLLAQGEVHRKINVIVEKASTRAITKIENVGGSVTISKEN